MKGPVGTIEIPGKDDVGDLLIRADGAVRVEA
jgi:hypothetical protein